MGISLHAIKTRRYFVVDINRPPFPYFAPFSGQEWAFLLKTNRPLLLLVKTFTLCGVETPMAMTITPCRPSQNRNVTILKLQNNLIIALESYFLHLVTFKSIKSFTAFANFSYLLKGFSHQHNSARSRVSLLVQQHGDNRQQPSGSEYWLL